MSIKVKSPPRLTPQFSTDCGELYIGDTNTVMPSLAAVSGLAGKVDLVFADPPFNIGHDYGEEFTDRLATTTYQKFTLDYLKNIKVLLRYGGALFLHLPDALVGFADVTCRALGLQMVNWIILHQEFGQYGESRFITSKVHLLYFVKAGGTRTWNVEEILEPSHRLRTGDGRIATARFKGMRPMLDVWYGDNLGRVQGNNGERWVQEAKQKYAKHLSLQALAFNHPNQLPEMYLARIIRCASKLGDLVFDPFTGSGTSWVVSQALGRRWVGTELTDYIGESAFVRVTRRGVVRDVKGKLANSLPKV